MGVGFVTSRHFFAGVNTPDGFYSCFDSIADDRKVIRKVYIKGGAGTGKSSLMKKAIKKADEEGYKTDIFHCSSDPKSVDGVYIPALKTALLDATAPHCYDPRYPGVSGEYFNCASFLNDEKLREHREDIIYFDELKKRAFEKAYNYLSAAQKVLLDLSLSYKRNMYIHGIELEAQKFQNKILPEITMPKSGMCRKMFLSAVGPDGVVNYLKEAFKTGRTFIVKGGYGTSHFIRRIMETALWRGFSVEAFYCPMFPDEKIEHLIISDINVNITTYNYYHHHTDGEVIDLDEYCTEIPARLEDAWGCIAVLLRQAISALSEARAAHSFLESFYVPAMDFEGLEEQSGLLIKSIFA